MTDFTPDRIDLVIAYLKGDLTFTQLAVACGVSRTGNSTYRIVALIAKELYRRGELKIRRKAK